MHPLRNASIWVAEIGQRVEAIAVAVWEVPILGEYLAMPFLYVAGFLSELARSLSEADDWISGFNLDYFIEDLPQWVMDRMEPDAFIRDYFRRNITGWIMYRLGFDLVDALLFSYYPIGFIKRKIGEWFPFLEPMFDDPFGWIREKIVERVPALGYLFEDPAGWVLYMLGVPWWERVFWSDHLFAWLLYRWGLPMVDALMFEASPISWIEYQVLKRWPFLDDLIWDPIGWIWEEFKEAVDRYIDLELDWLVRTVERVLCTIWEMRL